MNTPQAKHRIGILGGMGPAATVLLMSRIINLTNAEDDCDHIPLIIDNNTRVPSRIRALIQKTGEDPDPVLAQMTRQLEQMDARALAMPCNTAHHYAPVIEQAVDIPLINMVDLSASKIADIKPSINTVGILASPAVKLTGIFDRAFARFEIDTSYPADQHNLLSAIQAAKIDSRDNGAQSIMQNSAQELMAKGADILLVACSELSIIADAIPPSIPFIDSVDVLAEAVVEFAETQQQITDYPNPDISLNSGVNHNSEVA